MTRLTVANQLTLLRMLLIPAFVIMVVYHRPGWALATFVLAGITDGLDGLIARRANQQTSLGAWLDPMADKLLLVTTFVVLTVPGTDLVNRFPLWLTILVITRDVVIVTTVAIVTAVMGVRTFKPSVFGKIATGVLPGDVRRPDVVQLPRTPVDSSWRSGSGRRSPSRCSRASTTSGTRPASSMPTRAKLKN